MGSTKRLTLVLVAGLLFSFLGAAVIKKQEKFVENPLLAASTPSTVSTTTTTTAPPAPTSTAAPIKVQRAARPVSVPKNAHAAEPITEIGTIEIPRLGLFHKIMHGISLRNIDHGPSHWPGTAFPGENGNTVFAGHRTTHSKPFRNIHLLEPGDPVIFHIQGIRSVYTVTGSEIVYPDALHITNQTENATGTLFACHPPGSAKQRYVVHLALLEVGPDN
ncbi:MAG: class E sortase [Acidimicrobiales bacterium]|nr:class E sortase [Acidimicrobiales bacterium]